MSKMKTSLMLFGVLVSLLICCFPAFAGSLNFTDPVKGPVEVYTFDWIPGNGLADGALPLTTDPNAPTRFQQLFHASLGNFLDGNGNVIVGTGLNTQYEITIVSSFGQMGVRSPLDTDADAFIEIERAHFVLD